MKRYTIGLDNGGTATKAAIFDMNGRELCVAARKTPVFSPRPGYIERDAEDMWEANCDCIREVLNCSGVAPAQIAGIAVCGHGKGLYLWGRDGRPAFPGISSTDNRAWRIVEGWQKDGTQEKLYPIICQQLLACQQAALLRWLKENVPEAYGNIQYIFSAKDYIRFRLTGEAFSEVTDISGSGLLDLKRCRFDQTILDALGIGEVVAALPPLKYSSDLCGRITREAAELTGLVEGTPVAAGMFDVDACAIAMGMTAEGPVCTITGTWSINEFIAKAPILGTKIAMNSLYAIPGYYLLEESSATSAGNLEWVLDNCIALDESGDDQYSQIAALAQSVSAEDCDVYFLPFLYGSNAHPLARACVVGLTSYHTKAHLARAVFEGVAFSHRKHLDRLLSVRARPTAIRMAGGAVNSPFWVQLFADVLGYPIEKVDGVTELGALGCAMAVAVATGIDRDYAEAAKRMVRTHPPVLPDMEKHQVYCKKYEKYRAISDALDTVWPNFTT